MIKCLLILTIFTASCLSDRNIEINDLFKTLNRKDYEELPKLHDVVVKNLSIDLEKLNISTLTSKLKGLSFNISGDYDFLKQEDTRRLSFIGSRGEWSWASRLLVENKLFDMMLQTIYMARHKIQQIENEAYYNPQDTSYRIAFLHRRIRRIWKKMHDIYMTMFNNRHIHGKDRKQVFDDVRPFLILHHKAVKLHVDFVYLWWVLVKLHERYDYRHGIPNTTPFSSTKRKKG